MKRKKNINESLFQLHLLYFISKGRSIYVLSLNICILFFYYFSRPLFFFFPLDVFFFLLFPSFFLVLFSSLSAVSPLCQALFYSLNATCIYLPSVFFLLTVVLYMHWIIINFFFFFVPSFFILTLKRFLFSFLNLIC